MQQLGLNYSFIITVFFIPLLGSQSCENCKGETCDSRGICTDGCKAGYTDKYCQHRCQETCVKLKCKVDHDSGKTVCSDGCEYGYCGPRCKIPCPDGCLACDWYHCENCTLCRADLYGSKCEHSCLQKCNGFACSLDGTCSDSCVAGRYGAHCNMSCLSAFQSCHRFTGQCQQCQHGHFGDQCQHLCPSCLRAEEETLYTCRSGCKVCSSQSYPEFQQYSFKMQERQERLLATILSIVIVLLTINVVFIIVVCCVCCRKRKRYVPGTDTEMEPTVAAWSEMEALKPGPTLKSDVPATPNSSCRDARADTDLHHACEKGYLAEVKRILDTGRADVNSRDGDGRTPVMLAADEGHSDVVELLVSQGADVSLVDDYHDNILHLACIGRNRKTVEFVLSLDGVDVNSRGFRSWTPVMLAARWRRRDVVELLVSQGADVSLVDDDDNNILHYACMGGHRKTVEFVLSLDGVDVNARNNYRKTAADVAGDWRNSQVLDLLVSRGTQCCDM
ncbi:uncharacterized protein [Haliotis asinina]|uniref:uncharacterized protein isoform X1 n=1 Tax=Haliotis asinina TaxID=109174 RepID=UPI00353202A9